MYLFTSIFSTLFTVFMFLRMHHVHGSDSIGEKIVITVGCLIFLIQAGMIYQITVTDNTRLKRIFTVIIFVLMILYALLFFQYVDFRKDSIFSLVTGQ